MTEKKFIILVDIKEFTYKNSLLTNLQIEQMLQSFDKIVMKSAEENKVSIVKSIWDAYLACVKNSQEAIKYTQDVMKKTKEYDAQHKISIKKMDLRAAMSYGDITKSKTMNLDDYFGESINLASRIINLAPAGKIFLCPNAKENISKSIPITSVWEHSFHGILTDVEIFSLTKMTQKEILDLDTSHSSLLEECDKIVFRSACVSAILSAQPLPFIESFNIVGVHLYMIVKLSQKLERGVTLRSWSQIYKEMVAPLWAWYFGSQWLSTFAKIMLPGIWGYLFSPISFAVTYAMGKVYTSYFIYQKYGIKLSDAEVLWIFTKQKDVGKDIAKNQKIHIFKTGKQFYKDVVWIKQKTGYSHVQKDLISMLKTKK